MAYDFDHVAGLTVIDASDFRALGTYHEERVATFTCSYSDAFGGTVTFTYYGGAAVEYEWPSVSIADTVDYLGASILTRHPTAAWATISVGVGSTETAPGPVLPHGGLGAAGGVIDRWWDGCSTSPGSDADTVRAGTMSTDDWLFSPSATLDPLAFTGPDRTEWFVKPDAGPLYTGDPTNDASLYLWPISGLPDVVRHVAGFSSGIVGYGVDLILTIYRTASPPPPPPPTGDGGFMCIV